VPLLPSPPLFGKRSNKETTVKKKWVVGCVCIGVLVCAGSILAASTFVATSLNNLVVGGSYSQVASIRFQAKTNAPLAGLRVYWIIANPPDKPGYASGDGGHYTYTLHSDYYGQPQGALATASMVANQITENGRGNFPLICFPPVGLVSGNYYDIVVQNVDPNPTSNWASLDFLWNESLNDQTPDVQIWSSWEGGSFAWADDGTYVGSPVALFYADGTLQGYGEIAVGSEYSGGYECGNWYGFPATLCQQ
jgi:hypothetical protein